MIFILYHKCYYCLYNFDQNTNHLTSRKVTTFFLRIYSFHNYFENSLIQTSPKLSMGPKILASQLVICLGECLLEGK